MITEPVYSTRERIMLATDVKSSGQHNDLVDLVLQSASRQADLEAHRRFYPEVSTRRWDWPNYFSSLPWVLELDDDEVISLTSLVAGGTTIDAADYILRRDDGKAEPPYDIIEIVLSSGAAFASGATYQQSIVADGLFGYNNNTVTQGTLSADITGTVSTLGVSDSSIGVGSQIIIGTERFLVRDKAMVDTTQNLTNTLTAVKNDTLVGVGSGAAFTRGEIILIGAEKMRIEEIAGNNAIVQRGWDGTALATHAISDDIYAPRTLTVTRGFLGTTAATHTAADAVSLWIPPQFVEEYVVAIALNDKRLAITGYTPALTANKELDNKRETFYRCIGRTARSWAV